MSILDNILSKAKNATDVATKKTNEVLDSSKLKIKCVRLSNELKGKYEKLGLAIYNIMETGIQDDERLLDIADEIDILLSELKKTNDLLNQKQKEKICARCGTKNSNNQEICSICGFDLNSDDFDYDLEEDCYDDYDLEDNGCCGGSCGCDCENTEDNNNEDDDNCSFEDEDSFIDKDDYDLEDNGCCGGSCGCDCGNNEDNNNENNDNLYRYDYETNSEEQEHKDFEDNDEKDN